MAVKACYTDFRDAIKNIMEPGEAAAFIEYVKERAAARRARRLEPKAKAFNKTVQELIDEIDAHNKLKEIQYKSNAFKHQHADNFMKAFKKNYAKGIVAYYLSIESNIPKSRLSVAGNMYAREHDLVSYLYMQLEKEGLSHIFTNKKYDRQIALARAGIKVDDPNIMKIGKAIRNTFELGRKLANMQGASMSKGLDDYVARTSHNVERMKSATGSSFGDAKLKARLFIKHKGDYQKVSDELKERAFQRWYKFIRPLTDDKRTLSTIEPTAEAEEKFFRSFYNAVIGGIRKTPYKDEGSPLLIGLRRMANLADKLRAERLWHPKSPDAWLDYNEGYGFHNFHDALTSQLEHLGKSIGIMERMGTNPRAFSDRFIKKYSQLARDQNKVGTRRRIFEAQNFVHSILGDLSLPAMGLTARIIKNIKMIPLFHLGTLVPNSLGDFNTMASALSRYNVGYFKALSRGISDFAKGISSKERKMLAIRLGIYSDGSIMNTITRFGSVDSPKGLFAKMLTIQDKWSLINRLDNGGRFTMGTMISNELARHLKVTFGKLDPKIKQILDQYGIDEKTWRLLRTTEGKLTKDRHGKYLTPDAVEHLTKSSISKSFGKKANPLNVKSGIYNKLINLFQDQTLYGKTLPTASDRALMQMGVKRGSIAGELWQLILLFRSFDVANMRRTLGRFLYSGGAENLYDALIRGKADYKGMAKYMGGSLLTGYLSLTAGSLLAGRGIPDPTDPTVILASFMRGGGAFLYGAFLEPFFEKHGDLVKTVGGRGVGLLSDIMSTTYNVMNSVFTASGKSGASSFVRLVHNNLPFGNLLFLKPIIDRAIFDQIQQKIDPMYMYKLQRRLAKDRQHTLNL